MNLSDQLYKTYSISSPPKKGGMGSVVAPYGARGFGEVTPKGGEVTWRHLVINNLLGGCVLRSCSS